MIFTIVRWAQLFYTNLFARVRRSALVSRFYDCRRTCCYENNSWCYKTRLSTRIPRWPSSRVSFILSLSILCTPGLFICYRRLMALVKSKCSSTAAAAVHRRICIIKVEIAWHFALISSHTTQSTQLEYICMPIFVSHIVKLLIYSKWQRVTTYLVTPSWNVIYIPTFFGNISQTQCLSTLEINDIIL